MPVRAPLADNPLLVDFFFVVVERGWLALKQM
jgi:hypothetical protein